MKRRDFFKFISGVCLAAIGVKVAGMHSVEARVCERNVGTLRAVYPVGAIYISTASTSPATLFGFGTWQRFGNGRALVGVDENNASFNSVQQTGGAATHTLTSAQMPRHSHTQNSHNHSQNPHSHTARGRWNASVASGGLTFLRGDQNDFATDNTTATNIATTATNQFTGGSGTAQSASNGEAHNNLPPYITVFMWRRSA